MDNNSNSSIEKKISCNKQKGYMNSTNELKLKITQLFSKLNPKNQDGFLQKMKEYDLYSKLDLTEDQLSSASKQKAGSNEKPKNVQIPPPNKPAHQTTPQYQPSTPRFRVYSPDYQQPSSPSSSDQPQQPLNSPAALPVSPAYVPTSPYNYPPQSPAYAPTSPSQSPARGSNSGQKPFGQSPVLGPSSPDYSPPKSPDYFPPPSPDIMPPESPEFFEDLDDLAELEQFAEANEEFLDAQLQHQEKQFVNYMAISEAETIYRRDEIISELLDNFKGSEPSTIFSNDEKLKIWIDELLQLVDKVSTKDDQGHLTGIKKIDGNYKPIVDNFTSGKGTGVSWIVPVSTEKKKVYDVVNDGDYYYSVESSDELKKEQKIIEANPKNQDPETKFRGYDHQQKELYQLSKTSNNVEVLELDNDGSMPLNREVYYIHEEKNGKYELGKRVLDKGVYRLENRYENIGKKESKKKAETKAYETLGKKRLVGVEQETIVEPEEIVSNHFVVTKPGGKKLKPIDGFYHTETVKPSELDKTIINPFRSTREEYVLIREKICTKDPYSLDSDLPKLFIDQSSFSVSSLNAGDTILLNIDIGKIPTPTDQQEIFVNNQPYRFELQPRVNLATVPLQSQILAKVADVLLGEKREDGLYHYYDPYVQLEKTSVEPECMLLITPIAGHPYVYNKNWENIDTYIFAPRVSKVLKNETGNVKVGDDVMILLTDMFYSMRVLQKKMNFVLRKNPYFISDKENHLTDQKQHILHYAKCGVKHMDKETITLVVKESTQLLEPNSEITFSIDEFMYVYMSKNIEKAKKMIEDYLKSEEEVENVLRSKKLIPYRYSKDPVKSDADIPERLIWAKVVNHYYAGVNEYNTQDPHSMLQLLQPTLYDKAGDLLLVPDKRVEYRVKKYVFENKRFENTYQKPGDWIKGLVTREQLESVVPTIQEFINKLSNKLRHKESIHYSFIQDLSNLALGYEKYQLTDSVKQQINEWMNWSIVQNVENQVRNYLNVHNNFKEMLHLFETTDVLDPNKFRLNNKLDLKDLLNYSSWLAEDDIDNLNLEDVDNAELVQKLTEDLEENSEKWKSADKSELAKYQASRILEKSLPTDKKWDKIVKFEEVPKSKYVLVLDAIKKVQDPIIRNRLMIDFIEKYCYLGKDSSGNNWYFSKLDMTRTPLVCPHTYAELKSMPLTEFESGQLRDGSTVCKNCGEVLNTINFSYFEGYDEEDKIREKVDIVHGKEVVGTMVNTEIMIEKTFLFTEAETPQKYELEVIMNDYLSLLSKPQQTDVYQNVELKTRAIEDCAQYLLEKNILDFNVWLDEKKINVFTKQIIQKVPAFAKKTKEEQLNTIRNEVNIIRNFRTFVETKKRSIVLARLAILFEKEVNKKLRKNGEQLITDLIKSEETQNVGKGLLAKKPEAIEKFRTETISDYSSFISSGEFPIISELYKPSSSEYESEDVKVDYEDKFLTYTDSNIDDSLTLFDALTWLRFFIRKSHHQQKIVGELGQEDCVPGTKEFESYGTTPEQLATIHKLEDFIDEHMPKDENRTGVKSIKKFYSSVDIELPDVSENVSNKIEANLIIKNLYGIESNPDIMKTIYDKSEIKQKMIDLKTYQTEILGDMNKYRLIDYLVTYILDPETNKVAIRMFENGIAVEEDISRDELIERYKQMNISDLQTLADKLRQSEIQVEVALEPEKIYTKKSKTEETLNALFNKLIEKLEASLPDEEDRIEQIKKLLLNLEKDTTLDKSIQMTDKQRKIVLYKEYERLTKMLTYLKRDYNYLANGAKLREKKIKLAEKTGFEIDQLDDFQTEYDYIIRFMDLDYYDDLKQHLQSLSSGDIQLIELVESDKKDEISLLSERNIQNKFLFYSCILKILIQFTYDWDEVALDKWKSETIKNFDIEIAEDTDDTVRLYDRTLAKFIIEFVSSIDTIFRREEATLEGVENYKERNYEIVKQVERAKRMKHIDDIGSDLLKEFNKVMKGKRVLSVFAKESSSENGLETAAPVQQENYEEDPNGAGNYGSIFGNDLEGDEEYVDEEQAYDDLE